MKLKLTILRMVNMINTQTSIPKVIAICGLKRSGKDTIADYLCNKYDCKKVKIATPLKDALKVLFNFTDEQLEGSDKDKIDASWGIEPRRLMQFFGTEVMQYQLQDIMPKIGRNFWIKRLVDEHIINNNDTHKKIIVIPDLRFVHEYEILKQYNTVFWRIDRTFQTDTSLTQHISEQEYMNIPVGHIYKNNNSKELLYQDIDNVMRNIHSIKTDSHIPR
jgi:hypothetical protein